MSFWSVLAWSPLGTGRYPGRTPSRGPRPVQLVSSPGGSMPETRRRSRLTNARRHQSLFLLRPRWQQNYQLEGSWGYGGEAEGIRAWWYSMQWTCTCSSSSSGHLKASLYDGFKTTLVWIYLDWLLFMLAISGTFKKSSNRKLNKTQLFDIKLPVAFTKLQRQRHW